MLLSKHSVMEVFFVVIILPHWFGWGDFMLRKEPRNTEAPHINIYSPKKTSQHIKFSHKKKYCGIKDIKGRKYIGAQQKYFLNL